MPKRISRRTFLRQMGVGTGAVAWAASGLNGIAPESGSALNRLATTSFSYWAVLNGNVAATLKNYNDMLCYQETEKRTGVHIDFQHISDAGAQNTEQFNLLVASGQYPDMIEWDWLNAAGGPSKYIKDGVIVKLNDLI